jgi:hypothetical protein
MIRFIGVIVVALIAGVAHAQDDLWDRVEAVERIGKEINDHDQSAWHVTDALMAAVPNARSMPVAYITERVDAEHVRTVFILMDGEPTVFFTGMAKGSEVVSTENFSKEPEPPLATAAQIAQLNAKMKAREATNHGLCGKPVNTIALPGGQPGEFHVYALASETEQGVVQMGGHVRFTVGAGGELIEDATRSYSASCVSLEKTKDSVAFVITLPPVISDIPTEVHVFKSLSHDVPLFVSAEGRLWEVSGGQMKVASPMPVRAN